MAIVKLENGEFGEISNAIYETSVSYEEVKENIYDLLTQVEKDKLDSICSFCYAFSSSYISENNFNSVFDDINLTKALNLKANIDEPECISIYKYFDILKLSYFFNYDYDSFMNLYKTTNKNNYDVFFRKLLIYKRKMDDKTTIKLKIKMYDLDVTIEELARYFSVSIDYIYNLYLKGLNGDEIFSKVYDEKKYRESINKLMEVIEFTELNEIGFVDTLNYYANLVNKKRSLINLYIGSDINDINSISVENFLTLFINDYYDCNIDFYNESDYELIDKCKKMLLDYQKIDRETLSDLLFIAMNKKPNNIYNTELFKQIYDFSNYNRIKEENHKTKIIDISKIKK